MAFAWISTVFFFVLGQALPTHNIQASLFLSLSALFAVDFFTNTTRFSIPPTALHWNLKLIGFEVEDLRFKNTHIVLCTADARMGSMLAERADFLLNKPVDTAQLQRMADRLKSNNGYRAR